MEQLSGVMIIIIIGGAVLTCVTLFIFAKRQIMRFTLRSCRGPHVPVGNDAKKALRREIERRLDCIQKIVQEPKLLWEDDEKYILQPDKERPPYYYRMLAVDDVKVLEKEIALSDGSTRHPFDSLRAFLLTTLSATMGGSGQRMVHQFCDMYEHARHDPNEFGSEEYDGYHRLLFKLIDAAKQLKAFASSRKTSPRTPRKQTKMHSLLDPARLRPPPIAQRGELSAGHHSKVNLTLGLQGHDVVDVAEINSLHLQAPAERDILIRNRIKTPTLESVTSEEKDGNNDEEQTITLSAAHAPLVLDDSEITSISSVQFPGNSSVV